MRTPARREDEAQRERRPAERPAAHPLLALQQGAGNRAVTHWLARDPLLLPGLHDKRQAVEDLEPVPLAALYWQYKTQGPVGIGLEMRDHSQLLTPEEAETLEPLVRARKEQVFADFAAGRQPLYAAMTGAADAAARHEATAALSTYDDARLPGLIGMRDAMGKTWDVDDAPSRDAVLAAIQLQAATAAIGELTGTTATIRTRVQNASNMSANDDWCGFFTADHYVTARMDEDMRAGFHHVIDVEGFFTYVSRDDLPARVKRWVWNGTDWQSVQDFHSDRGASRQWLAENEVVSGGVLDIRPGDTVLLDWGPNGKADHIAMVASYDPATSTLVTIGGNDSGFSVRPPTAAAPAADAKREAAEQATGLDLYSPGGDYHVALDSYSVTAAAGQARGVVYGIGRPSLVDFEEHVYSGTVAKPRPLKTH
jgi:hypothetical protein